MAEFHVIAQARNGYEVGDPVSVHEDGADCGRAVTLPGWWRINVPIDLVLAKSLLDLLWEPAQEGDPEFEAKDDADKRIRRHKRNVRVVFDLLPRPKQNDLMRDGVTTLSFGQARQAYRRLTYNRGADTVDEGAEIL